MSGFFSRAMPLGADYWRLICRTYGLFVLLVAKAEAV